MPISKSCPLTNVSRLQSRTVCRKECPCAMVPRAQARARGWSSAKARGQPPSTHPEGDKGPSQPLLDMTRDTPTRKLIVANRADEYSNASSSRAEVLQLPAPTLATTSLQRTPFEASPLQRSPCAGASSSVVRGVAWHPALESTSVYRQWSVMLACKPAQLSRHQSHDPRSTASKGAFFDLEAPRRNWWQGPGSGARMHF